VVVSAVICGAALKRCCNRGFAHCHHSNSPRKATAMSTKFDIDARDDDLFFTDDTDLPTTPWSLDELERSADLGSVRSAWAGSDAAREF
jgi:hypothetical protein